MGSKDKLFTKDFTLVLVGQIISLFANSILGFAVLLYLLNRTGSAVRYGSISAASIIPVLILSPVGGMVILDFTTMGIILLYTWMLGNVDLVTLTLCVLLIFAGIKGIYSPTVNASIPILVSKNNMVKANSAVNTVSSLVNLISSSLAGIMYAAWGIQRLLFVSAICFGLSAVMEIFIHIPPVKQKKESNIFRTTFLDIKSTFFYIKKQCPSIWQVTLVILALNGIVGALLGTCIPVVITQQLGFESSMANRFYGYFGSINAAGGLLGAFAAGKLLAKIKISKGFWLLIIASAPCMLIGFGLLLPENMRLVVYVMICLSGFAATFFCAVSSIQLMSCIQMLSPKHMIGKIMGCLSAICMCASPIGTAVYGVLLETWWNGTAMILIGAFIVFTFIAIKAKGIFAKLESDIL